MKSLFSNCCRYQPPCQKGITDCLLWLYAATTKRVSEEISHLVHEERLDISISGMIIFVMSKTIVNICLLKLTDLFGAGDIWSETASVCLHLLGIG